VGVPGQGIPITIEESDEVKEISFPYPVPVLFVA
jgi:hypothetical protein